LKSIHTVLSNFMPTCKTNQTVIFVDNLLFFKIYFSIELFNFSTIFLPIKKYLIVIIDCQPATTLIQKTPSPFKGRYTCFAVIVTTTTF